MYDVSLYLLQICLWCKNVNINDVLNLQKVVTLYMHLFDFREATFGGLLYGNNLITGGVDVLYLTTSILMWTNMLMLMLMCVLKL